MTGHLRRLEQELDRTRAAVPSLRRLLRPAPLHVELRAVRGRVHPVPLPAVELAVTTHVGEHDDIDVTYGELGAWVVANAPAVAGPVRGTTLVGPRDTADPSAWRTGTGWPVFRVAPR